jgi:hypothetical protein
MLHDNAVTPQYMHGLICGYCGMMFDSRNALFKHLDMMGIDIGRNGIVNRPSKKRKSTWTFWKKPKRYISKTKKQKQLNSIVSALESFSLESDNNMT